MDAETGTLLYVKNGDEEISPASLTKLMTIHLALKAVEEGRVQLDDVVEITRESWAINMPYRSSLMFIAPGQIVSLRELLLGLAVSSGNDAASAVALYLAPSIKDFAERMTQEARAFGMEKTVFVEASGISEYNLTTALEFAYFCKEYLHLHPETLATLHSVRTFAYPMPENVAPQFRDKPGTITQNNRNTLLGRVEGLDGLKTGYIDESGYNIALTAEREGTRFIAVILGAPNTGRAGEGERIRNTDGTNLLEWGFENFKTIRPVISEYPPLRVWKGRSDWTELVPAEDLAFTAFSGRGEPLFWEIITEDPALAPLPAGSRGGKLVFYDTQGELRSVPLLTVQDIEKGSFFKRLWDSIRLFFRSLINRQG